jgi:thioredoxin reductase (NADPH)
MEEATFLTKFAAKVTIVHRRDEFRASAIMAQRALDHPKIDVIWNAQVTEIHGTDEVTGVTVTDTVSGETREMPIDGVFIAIGHKPNTELFVDTIDTDDSGYIVLKDRSTRTNVEGVFAAGDVADSIYRQAITAAGSGCAAAIDAGHHLAELE